MFLLQCLELIEDVLRGNSLLVDPTLLALLGLHAEESASMLEHLQLVAVFNGTGTVRNRSNTIAQKRLLRRNVDILRRRLRPQPRAAASEQDRRDRCATGKPR